jgi:hypothetical protein
MASQNTVFKAADVDICGPVTKPITNDRMTDYEKRIACRADSQLEKRLVELVAQSVFDPDGSDRASFHLALLEMRSQGPFNERIQRQLDRARTRQITLDD